MYVPMGLDAVTELFSPEVPTLSSFILHGPKVAKSMYAGDQAEREGKGNIVPQSSLP